MSIALLENTKIVQTLREKLVQKREELLDILAEKDKLDKTIKPKVLYEYEMIFGALESELQEKNRIAQIYEQELLKLMSKAKRGEGISNSLLYETKKTIEYNIINKQSKAKSEINKEDGKFLLINGSINKDEAKAMKLMFRKLVKYIHPDANKGQNYFIKHWDSVLDAYKMKDFGRIIAYYNLICIEDDENPSNHINSVTLEDSIMKIQRRIDFERRKLQRILMSEPYSLKEKLSDENWKAERSQSLKLKIRECEKSLDVSMRLFDSLKQDAEITSQDDEDSAFQEEFVENTYFKR